MVAFPKTYNKEQFVHFLEKNNVKDNIINKFVELPESVERSGNTFDLYIQTIWYGDDETHYSFELNYYSEDLIEYLFSSKVSEDIETSINNLTCELINAKYLKKNGNAKCRE